MPMTSVLFKKLFDWRRHILGILSITAVVLFLKNETSKRLPIQASPSSISILADENNASALPKVANLPKPEIDKSGL